MSRSHDKTQSFGQPVWDTTPCRITRATLHGVVYPKIPVSRQDPVIRQIVDIRPNPMSRQTSTSRQTPVTRLISASRQDPVMRQTSVSREKPSHSVNLSQWAKPSHAANLSELGKPQPSCQPHSVCWRSLAADWGRCGYQGSRLKFIRLSRYRGTSLVRKGTPLGPYRRTMPRILGGG